MTYRRNYDPTKREEVLSTLRKEIRARDAFPVRDHPPAIASGDPEPVVSAGRGDFQGKGADSFRFQASHLSVNEGRYL